MSQLAERILGDYVYNWGQSREVRINTLNRALKAAEIKCQVYVDKTGTMLYDAESNEEMKRAIMFRCGFMTHPCEDRYAHIDAWIETFRQRKDKPFVYEGKL